MQPFYYTLTCLSREIFSTILTDPVDRGVFPAEAGTSKDANQVGFSFAPGIPKPLALKLLLGTFQFPKP
jgi:hypothetical protein